MKSGAGTHPFTANKKTMPDSDSQTATERSSIKQTLQLDGSNQGDYLHRIKWIVLAVLALATLLTWQHVHDESQQASTRYVTACIERGDLTVTVSATGSLQPVNQVDVGSEISGTLRSVEVDFNDAVKKGQVLATLHTDQLQARVSQARAALGLARAHVTEAEATLTEARNKLKRSQQLGLSNMNSQEDRDAAQAAYERAQAALESNRAQVVQAQASLQAEKTSLEKATIVSPINGIVLKRDAQPGKTVAASFQTPVLFTLAEDLAQMELHVDVDEADVGQVKAGQQASFTVDAYPNRSFPAQITRVHFASQTVDGVVTYETLLLVDNSELLLRPGMTASADIVAATIEDALLVPNAALRFSPTTETPRDSPSSGGLLGSLLPHPPRNVLRQPGPGGATKQQQLWVLRDGQVQAISVKAGASDGVKTVIISDQIGPGMDVIIDDRNPDELL
jgi:HlyD family secretion protein